MRWRLYRFLGRRRPRRERHGSGRRRLARGHVEMAVSSPCTLPGRALVSRWVPTGVSAALCQISCFRRAAAGSPRLSSFEPAGARAEEDAFDLARPLLDEKAFQWLHIVRSRAMCCRHLGTFCLPRACSIFALEPSAIFIGSPAVKCRQVGDPHVGQRLGAHEAIVGAGCIFGRWSSKVAQCRICLLYTSDAADDS